MNEFCEVYEEVTDEEACGALAVDEIEVYCIVYPGMTDVYAVCEDHRQ